MNATFESSARMRRWRCGAGAISVDEEIGFDTPEIERPPASSVPVHWSARAKSKSVITTLGARLPGA